MVGLGSRKSPVKRSDQRKNISSENSNTNSDWIWLEIPSVTSNNPKNVIKDSHTGKKTNKSDPKSEKKKKNSSHKQLKIHKRPQNKKRFINIWLHRLLSRWKLTIKFWIITGPRYSRNDSLGICVPFLFVRHPKECYRFYTLVESTGSCLLT